MLIPTVSVLEDGGAGCDLRVAGKKCPSAGCMGLDAGWYWRGGKVLMGAVSCSELVLLSR